MKAIQNKLVAYMAIMMILLIPYEIVNHLPLARVQIHFLLGEEYIPFIPWTAIVYVSYFLEVIVVLWFLPKQLLVDLILMLIVIIILHIICFICVPTEYPRELYPTDNILLNFLRTVDGPGSCFPSLHVSAAILFAFFFGKTKIVIIKKIGMWLWVAAIIVSVLTTKQHYLVDVFGGILEMVTLLFFFQIIKKRIDSN